MNNFEFGKASTGRASPLFFFYRWVVIAPCLALSTVILGSTIVLLCLFGLADFSSRVLGRAWARLNMAVSSMQVDVVGRDKVTPGQSYIIVANHQSLVDIYALYGCLDMDIKWVMKKELRSVPVLGIACEMMGHIIVDRSNTEAALQSINTARDRIKDGISVVFFPEGTRSRSGDLQEFKKGAFRLATELGLPILPVTIHNTNTVLPSDTTELVPGRVTLEFGDPVPTEGLTSADINELSDRVRNLIMASLERGRNNKDAA
ncbi:MAG: lysophospholipid acyltransferase family protein [Pseudomonadales bacterium]